MVFLFPPGPREDPVFRVMLGGREVNRWRFDVVRLWEVDATTALNQGSPGLLALLPLMRGGSDLRLLEHAARRIEESFPDEELPDAESVLLHLAGRHYTLEEIGRMVGRGTKMWLESSVSRHFWNEGLNEGRLQAERELCLRMVQEYHPSLATAAAPVIQDCADAAQLADWAVSAPRLSDAEFARQIGLAARD